MESFCKQLSSCSKGHSIGFDHNNVAGSIMNPYYSGCVPNFKLSDHDITLVQDLYGAPSGGVTTTRQPTVTASKITSSLRPSSPSSSSSATTTRPHPTTPNPRAGDIPIKLYCLTAKRPVMMGRKISILKTKWCILLGK